MSTGKTIVEYRPDRKIFVQGDTADSVFYLRSGKVGWSAQRAPARVIS
jgi:CRP-like cAMP-binding protein